MTGIVMLLALLLPPCPTEDSQNCFWDASHAGNGAGVSLVNLGGFTIYAEGN